jgi:cobalt/nickel transport system permease protein
MAGAAVLASTTSFPRKRGGMATAANARGEHLARNGKRTRGLVGLAIGAAVLLRPGAAFAMHLSEGILPLHWAAAWWLAALPILGLASLKLSRRSEASPAYRPFVAMIAATVFVLSCMPIPVPIVGTCSHPCGTGLAAILVGPGMTVVVAFVALLLQALFLAHGGLSTLGADLWSMGIVGGLSGYLAFKTLRSAGASEVVSAFAGGVLSDWATYATTALQLSLALRGEQQIGQMFRIVSLAFVPTQLPLGLLEGALAACAVGFLARRRPKLLEQFARPRALALGREATR